MALWNCPVYCNYPGCDYSTPKAPIDTAFELFHIHFEMTHTQQVNQPPTAKEKPPIRFRCSRPNTQGITRRSPRGFEGNQPRLGKKGTPQKTRSSTKPPQNTQGTQQQLEETQGTQPMPLRSDKGNKAHEEMRRVKPTEDTPTLQEA